MSKSNIERFVTRALASGHTMAVRHCEGVLQKRTSDKKLIMEAIDCTDEDVEVIMWEGSVKGEGRIGSVGIIEDDIYDCSDNEKINSLIF